MPHQSQHFWMHFLDTARVRDELFLVYKYTKSPTFRPIPRAISCKSLPFPAARNTWGFNAGGLFEGNTVMYKYRQEIQETFPSWLILGWVATGI